MDLGERLVGEERRTEQERPQPWTSEITVTVTVKVDAFKCSLILQVTELRQSDSGPIWLSAYCGLLNTDILLLRSPGLIMTLS